MAVPIRTGINILNAKKFFRSPSQKPKYYRVILDHFIADLTAVWRQALKLCIRSITKFPAVLVAFNKTRNKTLLPCAAGYMRLITGECLSPLRAGLIIWILTIDVQDDSLANSRWDVVRSYAQKGSHLPTIQAPEVQQTAVVGVNCRETKPDQRKVKQRKKQKREQGK